MRYGSTLAEYAIRRLTLWSVAAGRTGPGKAGGEDERPGETFARLYDEFMPKVFRYIRFRVNDERVTEDLTSAVFEKGLVNFSRYNADRAAFSTWIFTITRNVVIDHYRTAGRKRNVPLDEAAELPSKDPSTEEAAEKSAERERLRMCIESLSREEQEIIRLKFAGEFNNREIAKILGLSESNVGTKLFRAVRKMRDKFQESWDA